MGRLAESLTWGEDIETDHPMFKRAVITVQPDITAQPPVVMSAPRVTDHKANRWLKRRGRDSRAPCSRFSRPTLVRSFVFIFCVTPTPKNANQQTGTTPTNNKSGDLSTSDPHIFLGTFVCLLVGSVISRALRDSLSCVVVFLR